MIITKVGRRGQITIPRQVRQWLNLQEQDRVAFIRAGNAVMLLPLTHTLLEMRGSVPVEGPQDFQAIRQQVIAEHGQRIGKGEA
ncbi:MAG: AbrB/MazE/SpoVT family DNA-binding domain-containing protein [Caldilineae bacterium]|nr:MAG: AbrB/MazE/SpoVT family DNA-binding domain-containing protein [Caldilineae bacterium]